MNEIDAEAYFAAIARAKNAEAENAELRHALGHFSQLLADRHSLYRDNAVVPVNVMVGWLREADRVMKVSTEPRNAERTSTLEAALLTVYDTVKAALGEKIIREFLDKETK